MKRPQGRKWLGPPRPACPVDMAELGRELPGWAVQFFLHRVRPEPGTPERIALDALEATKRDAIPPDSLARDLWLRHRTELMQRWQASGGSNLGPWGTRYDRDPYADPRELLMAEAEQE